MSNLLRPLNEVLGSRTKVALLRELLASGGPLSARESARLAGVAHSGALAALDDLVELGIVDRTETPGQHLYTVNCDNILVESGLAPMFASEQRRLAQLFAWIQEELQSRLASTEVKSVVVFGSAARGEDRAGSDFDLLVVVRAESDVAAIHRQLADGSPELFRRFGLSLSPVVMAVDEIKRRHQHGDSLIESVSREGRQVAGPAISQLLETERRVGRDRW